MATGTDPKKGTLPEGGVTEDRTQLIPHIEGGGRTLGVPSSQARVEKIEKSPTTVSGAPEGVPQETVPMDVVAWPPSPSASAEPDESLRPPPILPRRGSARHDSGPRVAEISPRPGLFTTELRRALPAWALPILTFQPFSVWLGARVGLLFLGILATLMIPAIPARGTANWYGLPGGPPLSPLVDSVAGVWTRWDGQWYLKIATEGYSPTDGSGAFFPLYPWTVKVVGWLAGERYAWAGILLSSLFFLVALVLLHRLVRLDFHPKDASRTIFYAAAFPMSFFFWAVYSESLFLLLAVGTFLAARTAHWFLAGLCVALAIWTRPTGVLLLLPLAWEMWRAFHPPMPTAATPNAMPPKRPSSLILASFALPALGIAGLLGWSATTLGSATAFLDTQKVWNRNFAPPWETVVNAVRSAFAVPYSFQVENQSWTYLLFFVFALVCGVLAIRWLRGSYSIFMWAGILLPLFSTVRGNPLLSYPRFMIVLFPMFIVMSLGGRNRYVHQVITWVSVLLLALFTIRFVNWYWVA